MSVRGWLLALIMLSATYGCLMIIVAHYGRDIGPAHHLTAYLLYQASPWLLVPSAFVAWRTVRTWRRMSTARRGAPSLSRGAHRFDVPADRPSALEKLCHRLLALGLATLPYWFHAPGPEWFLAAAFAGCLFFRLCLALMQPRSS